MKTITRWCTSWFLTFVIVIIIAGGFLPVAAQGPLAVELPYFADFEAPAFESGSVEGQGGWTVQQGAAEIRTEAGLEQSQGLVIHPSEPFGQASLVLKQPSEHPMLFIDLWLRPISSTDEEEAQFLDADGVIAGFLRIDQTGQLQVMDGNGEQGGEWIGTNARYEVPETGVSPNWLRLTFRIDYSAEKRHWDLYVDGFLEIFNLGLWDNSAAFQRLSLMGHSTKALHIDELGLLAENPLFDDQDRDGIPDAWETANNYDPSLNDREADPDGDGRTALEEWSESPSEAAGERGADWLPEFSDDPSDDEIATSFILHHRMVRTHNDTAPEERRALVSALSQYAVQDDKSEVELLTAFLEQHPSSAYRLWIEASMAKALFEGGRFSRSLETYDQIWERVRDQQFTDPSVMELANLAGAELSHLYARLGRKAELEQILAEFDERTVSSSSANELVFHAGLGLHVMELEPTQAFNCGAYALQSIREARGRKTRSPALDDAESTPLEGFTLAEVRGLAAASGMDMRMARRVEEDAPWVVPSVVHWNSEHYAAIVAESDGEYHVKDPTFSGNFLVTPDALEEEASGYFLIPSETLPQGWEWVTVEEGMDIRGRGAPTGLDERDRLCPDTGPCRGLAGYAFNHFRASLEITDTPVSLDPPRGQAIDFTAFYDETRTDLYWYHGVNLANERWMLAWNSYALKSGSDVILWLPGGNKETYELQSGSTYKSNRFSSASLQVVNPGTNETYKRLGSDGSVIEFALAAPSTWSAPRRYLTKITDPQGNAISLTYTGSGGSIRLDKITDPVGNYLQMNYMSSSSSSIFYRTVIDVNRYSSAVNGSNVLTGKGDFDYDSVNITEYRLKSIQDVEYTTAGSFHKSQFLYDTTDVYLIKTLRRPFAGSPDYRDVTFTSYASGTNGERWIEATDGLGLKERAHYKHDWGVLAAFEGVTWGASSAVASETPSGFGFENYRVREGVTLYWDKKALKDHPTAPTSKALQTQWMRSNKSYFQTVPLPASIRDALSSRIWYRYQGQSGSQIGTVTSSPSDVMRMVNDKTTPSNTVLQRTSFVYAANGSPSSITDPIGRTTAFTYDTNGIDVLTVKENNQTVVSFTYPAVGDPAYGKHVPATITDGGANVTTLTYNSFAQLKTVVNTVSGNTHTTTFAYDRNPKSTTENSDDGYLISINRKLGTGSDTLIYGVAEWDNHKRPYKVDDADLYRLQIDRDKLDRITTITHPDLTTEQFSYANDSAQRLMLLQKYTDRGGKTTRYFYNKNEQLIQITDALGLSTKFEWCSCGDLESVQDPSQTGSVKTVWHRDLLGRVTSKVYPDGKLYSYAYESHSGLLSSVTTPNDQGLSPTKTYRYEVDGNLYKIQYPTTSTPSVTYTYDQQFDRIATRQDGVGTWTYAYYAYGSTNDGAGKLRSITGPWSYNSATYTYDDLGRLKRRHMPNIYVNLEFSSQWTFDYLDRITQEVNQLGTFTYAYDGNGEVLDKITYPNGQVADYNFGSATTGRYLQSILNRQSASGPFLSTFSYTYGSAGEILKWTKRMPSNSSGSTYLQKDYHHTYDAIYQLDKVDEKNYNSTTITKTWDFNYDSAWNRTRKTIDGQNIDYTPNSRNQFINQKNHSGTITETFTYDNNGNMTSRTETATDKKTVYTWDGEDRLLTIERRAGLNLAANDKRTLFAYDGLGRRVQMSEQNYSGSVWTNDSVTYFLWIDDELCQARFGSTSWPGANFYVRGEIRFPTQTTNTKYFYNLDHLGTVTEMTDSSAVIVAAYRYGPWGERTAQMSTTPSDFGFTGHYAHGPSALHLPWFRAYDAEIGRWLSPDPLGEVAHANLYNYANNNPIMYLDPHGLIPAETVLDAASIGASAISLARNPSWGNFGFLAWDVVATVVPYVPGSYTVKCGRQVAKPKCPPARAEGTYGELRSAGAKDAHHVIQHAAVRDLPGYNRNAAPAVQLQGPSTRPGSEHYNATQAQRRTGGGTYAAERRTGYRALRQGGLSRGDARRQIGRADQYFGRLGVSGNTQTRIPANRRSR